MVTRIRIAGARANPLALVVAALAAFAPLSSCGPFLSPQGFADQLFADVDPRTYASAELTKDDLWGAGTDSPAAGVRLFVVGLKGVQVFPSPIDAGSVSYIPTVTPTLDFGQPPLPYWSVDASVIPGLDILYNLNQNETTTNCFALCLFASGLTVLQESFTFSGKVVYVFADNTTNPLGPPYRVFPTAGILEIWWHDGVTDGVRGSMAPPPDGTLINADSDTANLFGLVQYGEPVVDGTFLIWNLGVSFYLKASVINVAPNPSPDGFVKFTAEKVPNTFAPAALRVSPSIITVIFNSTNTTNEYPTTLAISFDRASGEPIGRILKSDSLVLPFGNGAAWLKFADTRSAAHEMRWVP